MRPTPFSVRLSMDSDDRYVFLVEWYDQPADLVRKYHLTYYCFDRTIEMFDLKNRRSFLKRTQAPGLSLADLFLGNTLTLFARQLKIVDFADAFTKSKFESRRSRTFALIKPDAYSHLGSILTLILQSGFKVNRLKMLRLSPAQAQTLYLEHQSQPNFSEILACLTSDVVTGLELVGENAVSVWRELMGPANSLTARVEKPDSIRAKYGTDGSRNAVHGSDSQASAGRELEFFFSLPGNSAMLNNCTCCIIKPHAMPQSGAILTAILEEGFEVSALQLFNLDKQTAEDFLEVYKGVLQEYAQLVEELASGPCLVLEVRQENVVSTFRVLCGPFDPDTARRTSPQSLRAKFGTDRVRNAVHCTDLQEDGVLEVEFFFQLLASK